MSPILAHCRVNEVLKYYLSSVALYSVMSVSIMIEYEKEFSKNQEAKMLTRLPAGAFPGMAEALDLWVLNALAEGGSLYQK